MFAFLLHTAERGKLPDALIRLGIRQLLKARLRQLYLRENDTTLESFVHSTQYAPIGFVLVAWTAFIFVSDRKLTDLLLPSLTTIWGVRLSWHLAWRNHGKPEDFRYQAMRSAWGKLFPLVSFLTVFSLQGVIMWIVSLPIQVGVAAPTRDLTWLSTLGVTIWAIGLFFEVVGDWQLVKFKSDTENRGSVLDVGLWRYTRHPNYFGDFLVWWGLYFIAMSQSTAWWTAVGPLVMSVLLMRVSGVTLLEKSLLARKPGYAEYVARTNAFFPGLPRL